MKTDGTNHRNGFKSTGARAQGQEGGGNRARAGAACKAWPGVHRASVQVLKESGGPRRRGGECDGDALCRYAVFGPVRRASAGRGTT